MLALRRKGTKWVGAWLAALGGGLWCCSYTWPLLDPFSLDVVFQDDWSQHTLGWLFFRRAAIGYPIGALPNFLHPTGTTLGYMDAIPWIALLLRPLSPWLPLDFQFLGLWILLSSTALAFIAARIAALSTPHWEQQALAGIFTAMAPALIERIIHPALCGHVFIVAALALQLAPACTCRAALRSVAAAGVVIMLGSATHPYFAVMTLLLLVALPARLLRQLGGWPALGATVGLVALALIELTVLGYLGGGMRDDAGGFGEFSANLNTFWNSMDHSRLFPGLPYAFMQYEGYCYLGAGCFFLVGVAVVLLVHPRTRPRIATFPWRRARWPSLVACALAMFALASPLRWGESELLRIELYERFEWLVETFRSSGRFIWPLAYLINIALFTTVLRALRNTRWAATWTLLAALALQVYDLDTSSAQGHFDSRRTRVYDAPQWTLAEPDVEHLVLYPAEILGACEGPHGYRDRSVTELAYLAYRHGWTFNSGYAARLRPSTESACEQLKQQVRQHALDARSLYVVGRRDVGRLRKAGAVCGRIERLHVCAPLAPDHPFARYLAEHPR